MVVIPYLINPSTFCIFSYSGARILYLTHHYIYDVRYLLHLYTLLCMYNIQCNEVE